MSPKSVLGYPTYKIQKLNQRKMQQETKLSDHQNQANLQFSKNKKEKREWKRDPIHRQWLMINVSWINQTKSFSIATKNLSTN